jgi:cell wall-associated NlpC family hydrolase
MGPAVGIVLVLFGVLLFTQTTMGDAVGRLLSYKDPTAAPTTTGSSSSSAGGGSGPSRAAGSGAPTGRDLVAILMKQKGDDYVWGAGRSGGKNPEAFDCSGLIYWGMGRLGFKGFPSTSGAIYEHCQKTSVSKAIATPGAILWREGHIAVSRGNGTTIEARSSDLDVGVFSATVGRDWASGGFIPELSFGSVRTGNKRTRPVRPGGR